jgi:hypothetical protein
MRDPLRLFSAGRIFSNYFGSFDQSLLALECRCQSQETGVSLVKAS